MDQLMGGPSNQEEASVSIATGSRLLNTLVITGSAALEGHFERPNVNAAINIQEIVQAVLQVIEERQRMSNTNSANTSPPGPRGESPASFDRSISTNSL